MCLHTLHRHDLCAGQIIGGSHVQRAIQTATALAHSQLAIANQRSTPVSSDVDPHHDPFRPCSH